MANGIGDAAFQIMGQWINTYQLRTGSTLTQCTMPSSAQPNQGASFVLFSSKLLDFSNFLKFSESESDAAVILLSAKLCEEKIRN